MGSGKKLDWEKANQKTRRYSADYNYSRYTRSKWATDKQHDYAEHMIRLCEERGIDTSFANFDTMTKNGCSQAIHACYTLLEKNGYDQRGNELPTTVYKKGE